MPEKKKTPEYTAKAIEKYHAKFDRIAVSLPKGSKEWIKEKTGKSCNAFFNDLFREYQQRQPDFINTPDLPDDEMPFH